MKIKIFEMRNFMCECQKNPHIIVNFVIQKLKKDPFLSKSIQTE